MSDNGQGTSASPKAHTLDDFKDISLFKLQFEITRNVQMRIRADKLVQNFIFAVSFRVIGLMINVKDMFFDLLLSSMRLILVQSFDNVRMNFWLVETIYVIVNFIVNTYCDVAISRLQSATSLIYLLGIMNILVIFGRTNKIQQL